MASIGRDVAARDDAARARAARAIAARDARRCARRARQIDRAQLEDRQVHRDHEAADDDAEEHDDDRLEQARQRRDRVVDLALVEVGDLAQHVVERARLLADLRHLQHHDREQRWCSSSRW